MAAVIAAIVAAGLAGAVALYRERRLELRNLIVAARVLSGVLWEASVGLDAAAKIEQITAAGAVARLRSWLGDATVIGPWEQHRNILAAHLPPEHWRRVSAAIRHFTVLCASSGPQKSAHPGGLVLILRVSHDMSAGSKLLDRYSGRAGWFVNPGRRSDAPEPPYSRDLDDDSILAQWTKRMSDPRPPTGAA